MKAKVGDIEIYYELTGEGYPLALIEGMGYSSWMWFKQRPALSRHFQLLIYDNRGVGLTDKPRDVYTIRQMADDLAGLLDALGIEGCHVMGISMGGFIAQEFALAYPDRVAGLILGCTSYGGPNTLPMPQDTLQALLDVEGLTQEQVYRQGMATAMTEGYFKSAPDEIDQIVAWRLENPQPRYAWINQFNAGAGHDTEDRIDQIKAPALVAHGQHDAVVPAENGRRLAAALGATFNLYDAGHLFFIEQADQYNLDTTTFLKEIEQSKGLEL